ncbi:MAG: hypothetical protein Q8R95_02345, partial [Azonexus sp.]|nr:hypothetical protein [Azonexus sp.]
MSQLRQLLIAASLFFAQSCLADSLLFIATSPVPQGKFKAVTEIGAKYGFTVEAHFAERLQPQQIDNLFKGHDAVFFDASRSHMQESVKNRLAKVLPGLKTPHIWMRDNGPLAEGFPQPIAERLHAYYTNGGQANYEGFFQTLAAHSQGKSLAGSAPPFIIPDAA